MMKIPFITKNNYKNLILLYKFVDNVRFFVWRTMLKSDFDFSIS